MRKCIVKDKEAYFHRWIEQMDIIEPSSMIGGHAGGQVKRTLCLIEYIENGTVHKCYPEEVIFIKERSYEVVYTGDGRSFKIYEDEESGEETNRMFSYRFTPKDEIGIIGGIVYAKTKELAEQKLWMHYEEHIEAKLIQDNDDVIQIARHIE